MVLSSSVVQKFLLYFFQKFLNLSGLHKNAETLTSKNAEKFEQKRT